VPSGTRTGTEGRGSEGEHLHPIESRGPWTHCGEADEEDNADDLHRNHRGVAPAADSRCRKSERKQNERPSESEEDETESWDEERRNRKSTELRFSSHQLGADRRARLTVHVHESVVSSSGKRFRFLLLCDLVERERRGGKGDSAELDGLHIGPEENTEGRGHGDGDDDADFDTQVEQVSLPKPSERG
jgi:hypothetical protein